MNKRSRSELANTSTTNRCAGVESAARSADGRKATPLLGSLVPESHRHRLARSPRAHRTDSASSSTPPPTSHTVEVYDDNRELVARGTDLPATLKSPMCLLWLDATVKRKDLWPTAEHVGLPVLLPGGEAASSSPGGTATTRWNGAGRLEFYNSRR